MKIGAKILIILLIAGLAPTLIIAAVSVRDLIRLSQYSMDANTRLAVRTSDDAQKALLGQAEQYIERIAREQAFKFEHILLQVQAELSTVSEYIHFLYVNEDHLGGPIPPRPQETAMGERSDKYVLAPGVELDEDLRRELGLLGNCKNIFSTLLGDDSAKNNIYLGTESGISYRFSRSNAYSEGYDPRQRQWYLQARRKAPEAVWVDTYVDAYGTVCVTCAVEFRDGRGEFRGVVAVDLTAVELQDDVERTKLGETGFAFLLDGFGTMVAYSPPRSAGVSALEKPPPKLPPKIVDAILLNPGGLLTADVEGAERYVAYAQLPSTGWRFGISVEKKEIVAPAVDTKKQVDAYIAEAQGHIGDSLRQVLLLIPAIVGIYIIAMLVMAYFLSRAIANPILDIRDSIRKFAGGDTNVKAAVTGSDEISQLATAFNDLTATLRAARNRDLSSGEHDGEHDGAAQAEGELP